MFETPVLFIVFNRPEETARVFEVIKKIKPKDVYIAADGARVGIESDIINCEKVKKIVKDIDWNCNIHTLYRKENLGCGLAVSGSIDWFFDNVEAGIILEDDCLPNDSFFEFCQKMLIQYQDKDSVMHISGSCYGKVANKENYHFTYLPFIWGWATWRRAWLKYDFNIKYSTPKHKYEIISNVFDNKDIRSYWQQTLRDFHVLPESYTWDYQWFLTIWRVKGLVIQPTVNLIENIGFGSNATHTTVSTHFLGRVKSAAVSITSFKTNEEVNNKFQNQNFYFYFNQKKSDTYFNRKKNDFLTVFKGIKFLGGKLVFKFLDYYSYQIFLFNPFYLFRSFTTNSKISSTVKLYPVYKIMNCEINDFTYVSRNSVINNTTIGKFCSIGPNLICGWGIHPKRGASTHPMFYSTYKQNGFSLSKTNKFKEFKQITIGNDVFIGMNVSILDGVTIGDGAIIGAGAVVSKDIPPYAIAVGNPIKIIDYRFSEDIIKKLLNITWWNSSSEKIALVEKYFFDVEQLIQRLEEISEAK